jgi:hypothetical protein
MLDWIVRYIDLFSANEIFIAFILCADGLKGIRMKLTGRRCLEAPGKLCFGDSGVFGPSVRILPQAIELFIYFCVLLVYLKSE